MKTLWFIEWYTSMSRIKSEELLRQLSYAIKNQLVASKVPY